MTTYLKAAAKTIAAAAVGWLGVRGIEVDSRALEVVLTGVFVGVGSIVVNIALILLKKTPFGSWAERMLPAYETKQPS